MSAIGEVVYIVTVKENKNYHTLKRVFSSKETAIEAMFHRIACIENSDSLITDDLQKELGEYKKQLRKRLTPLETYVSTDYVTEETVIYGASTETVKVVQGRITEVVVE